MGPHLIVKLSGYQSLTISSRSLIRHSMLRSDRWSLFSKNISLIDLYKEREVFIKRIEAATQMLQHATREPILKSSKDPIARGLRRGKGDGEYDSSGITILKYLELKFSKSFCPLLSPSHILRRSKTYSPSSCRSPVHGWIGTCAWYCEREHCPRLTLPWLKYRDFPCNSNDGTIGKRVQGHKLRTATANMGGIPAVKWLKYHT